MTTRAQRAFAIRMLAEAQRRLKGADVSTALEPAEVAALMEVVNDGDTEEGNARELVRHLG